MRDDINELVRLAFWAAREKGKPDWWRMTTPVLKNRLLTLTDRKFNEQDYASKTFLEFAFKLQDLVWVDTTTYPPELELRPRRIRPDLWTAITDHKSSRRYAWDSLRRIARPANKADLERFILPTLTYKDVAQWRRDFAERHRSTFSVADAQAADQWARRGLFHRSLPERLKGMWQRERSWRVWDYLSAWFNSQLPPDEVPTLSEVLDTDDVSTSNSGEASSIAQALPIADFQDDVEIARCRALGDWLAVGELLTSRLSNFAVKTLESTFAQIVAAWAQPVSPLNVSSIADLITHIDDMLPEQAATATINAAYRTRKSGHEIPDSVNDLVFRLSDSIEATYEVDPQRGPRNLCAASVAKLASCTDQLHTTVRAFLATNTVTAKSASIDLLRAAHSLRRIALVSERPYLRDLDILLGASFRKFCESCERHASQDVARRAAELREQAATLSTSIDDARRHSAIWTVVVRPVIAHVADLLEQGTRQSEELSRPALTLVSGPIRADLSTADRSTTISATLANTGLGRAVRIDLIVAAENLGIELELLGPQLPFDVAGNTNQVLSFAITVNSRHESVRVPLVWVCSDVADGKHEFPDELHLVQQSEQPDWGALLLNPPYTLNPVTKRDRLFGRDATLQQLLLHAAGATSTFLWGQKRVGKTSVLQVLAAELRSTGTITCIILRMGELVSLHEGQIAFTIATRLNECLGNAISIPAEDRFGAGMSRLVPTIERLANSTSQRLTVIIDEFDDLDSAFYTGERGRQFVKALRSLSEVGLTFFFVGSERMDTIYNRHAVELNKWVNISLDRIVDLKDCKELIEKPLKGKIEYADAASAFIVDYCGGNPFYMHLFCFETFKRCIEDHRTFVSETDAYLVRQYLLKTVGKTNFAHFWEDNPELVANELAAQSAENALALSCVASIGGRFDDVSEVVDAQDALGLATSEKIDRTRMTRIIERLRRRRVVTLNSKDRQLEIGLPMFREWLTENVDQVLPAWREHSTRESNLGPLPYVPSVPFEDPSVPFPIAEDALLEVSQRLVYCGKQKDVAEVRRWLRQFDDDSRIEVAFLLLERLAKNGYMSEGARGRALLILEEALQDRRTSVGNRTWRIVRGKKENLCITFVDSETKSGAATARDMAKRVRPAKVANTASITSWLRTHANDDSLLLIVDDFAGSGSTLETGIRKFLDEPGSAIQTFVGEGRVSCYCQFSFPEALDRLRSEFPRIEFLAATVLGDEVRAFEPNADLFESDEERNYAREVVLQIGRELTPQLPLGWGDIGALVAFHDTIPNNSLPIFWADGTVNGRPWIPLLPRA